MGATTPNPTALLRPSWDKQSKPPTQPVSREARPLVLARVRPRQVAQSLTTIMEGVPHAQNATAYATAGPNATTINIAGKTGTAQNGVNNYNPDDAVFTCFVPGSAQPIAVAVIVKGGGFGADAAAPIALKILQAYLGQQ